MMHKENHLTRSELIKFVRSKTNPDSIEHFQECAECLEAYVMLKKFSFAGKLPLVAPPIAWIEKAKSIPEQNYVAGRIARAVAKLAFDSWTLPALEGARGPQEQTDRRIRFESGSTIVDFRAEKKADGWSCIAQVIGLDRSKATVWADKKEIHPDKHGLCQWSQTRPPKKLSVVSENSAIDMPEIVWKTTPSKRRPGSF